MSLSDARGMLKAYQLRHRASTGQHELAIASTKEVHAQNPDATPSYGSIAFNQLFLNRLDDALLTVARATERKLQSTDLSLIPYAVAFLKGDEEELRRAGAVAKKNPGLIDLISHLEALALARSGRLQEARRLSAVPVEIAQRSGRRERAALFEAGRAVWEAFYGNAAAARQSATKALALGRGRNVDYAACTRSMFAEWPPSPPVSRRKLPPSSSGFSIIPAPCSSIPWARWRACSWHERSRSRATR